MPLPTMASEHAQLTGEDEVPRPVVTGHECW